MARTYGDRAKLLKRRLGVLQGAKSLDEVPTGSPDRRHMLTGDRQGQFSVTIKDNWRLVFVPANDPLPLREDKSIDLTKVTAIHLIEVVDYHGE